MTPELTKAIERLAESMYPTWTETSDKEEQAAIAGMKKLVEIQRNHYISMGWDESMVDKIYQNGITEQINKHLDNE